MLLILLASLICFTAASPLPDTLDSRRSAISQDQKALFVSMETLATIDAPTDLREPRKVIEDKPDKTLLPKTLKQTNRPKASSDSETNDEVASTRKTTQGRKNKAMFVDYPLIPRVYPRVPSYEINDYNNNLLAATERPLGTSKKYKDSNIFYIRLPPTPYMFVPGLGYISQPPTYSTVPVNKPQVVPMVAQLPQLLQLPATSARPTRPVPQNVNPFIKVPIDFVTNGKPTSVYQWQNKFNKKPADSPITNLDNLSAGFVTNGKPTSIYQWQTNLKPTKRPDNSLNSLDMGPYKFNGKPVSLYLLGPDGTSTMHQSIRPSDYQNDYRISYY